MSSTSSQNLIGRNAIVTGGSRGLGAQVALDLAKAGANILINYTSASSTPKADALLAEIRKVNPNAKAGAVQADVGSADIGSQILNGAAKIFSDGDTSKLKVHILVHNAAIAPTAILEEQTIEGIDAVFNVNVRGTFLITQALRPYIPSHDNARIIVVSSVSARINSREQGIYSASKAAVESFVRTWNNEFAAAQGITVNAVNPGPMRTDMLDATGEDFKKRLEELKRPVADPSDVSDVILFLASKESRWVTGSVVSTNRGILTF